MNIPDRLTAKQFVELRHELPDGGRWTELVGGKLVQLEPPDTMHGTAVLNLSKAIAEHLQTVPVDDAGYACFDAGLLVETNPDTVRFPAISYYSHGPRFAESEKQLADTLPSLVVDVCSTTARRRDLAKRVERYHAAGIANVWIVDPVERQIHVTCKDRKPRRLADHESLTGGTLLPGFRVRVGALFEEPPWWNPKGGAGKSPSD